MGIGQTIKKVAGGIGSAVKRVSEAVDKPFADEPIKAPANPMDANQDGVVSVAEKRAWEIAGHALTPFEQDGRKGFNLPDIDNEMDAEGKPNKFYIPKMKKNKDGVDEPNLDYVDASNVHKAFEQYDQILRESNPHIDYAKEYEGIQAEQKKNAEVKPRGNALSAFAIALGGGDKAAQQYNATNKEADQNDSSERERGLQFRKSLVDAHVKQLAEEGKWRDALKQNAVSDNLKRLLEETQKERDHKRDMEKTDALIGGRKESAQITAGARIRAVQERVKGIEKQVGLSGVFATAFQKEIAKSLAGLTKGLMNDPESGLEALPDILSMAEDIAERLKAEQDKQGEGGGGKPTPTGGTGKVRVKLPNGQSGSIPADKVDAFLKAHPGAVRQ